MRRNITGSPASTPCSIVGGGTTTRGYTNQEMVDSACLVNLNARFYDPLIARMPQADSVVGDAYNLQSYNRYSYVENRPVSATDPTGNLTQAQLAGINFLYTIYFDSFGEYSDNDLYAVETDRPAIGVTSPSASAAGVNTWIIVIPESGGSPAPSASAIGAFASRLFSQPDTQSATSVQADNIRNANASIALDQDNLTLSDLMKSVSAGGGQSAAPTGIDDDYASTVAGTNGGNTRLADADEDEDEIADPWAASNAREYFRSQKILRAFDPANPLTSPVGLA